IPPRPERQHQDRLSTADRRDPGAAPRGERPAPSGPVIDDEERIFHRVFSEPREPGNFTPPPPSRARWIVSGGPVALAPPPTAYVRVEGWPSYIRVEGWPSLPFIAGQAPTDVVMARKEPAPAAKNEAAAPVPAPPRNAATGPAPAPDHAATEMTRAD